MNNIDACLDVREGVGRGEDGFAFVLLDQVAMRSAVQREGRAVHEGTQVVVLVKIGDPFLQLVSVEERLHIGDLEVGLKHKQRSVTQNMHFSRYGISSHASNITLLGSSLFLSTGLESLIISTTSSPNLSE